MILPAPTALVLDETPLSLLTQNTGHAQGDACKAWYARLDRAGSRFYVPEVADYELRRELLRSGKTASLLRLDAFLAAEADRFLPLSAAFCRFLPLSAAFCRFPRPPCAWPRLCGAISRREPPCPRP